MELKYNGDEEIKRSSEDMMKLTMLGTGMATVTKCYNTCFALSEGERHFLVDGGGGNNILRILEEEKISLLDIHDVFVSHAHTDHIMGIIWVIRMIGQRILADAYVGELRIYCHRQLKEILVQMCEFMLVRKITNLFGSRIRFVIVENGQKERILDSEVEFFDIQSSKMQQFAFQMFLADGKRFVFAGDEPLCESWMPKMEGSEWLMHEAFCLYGERAIFKPYEKHHSTVKDACELAEQLHIRNLILYHTEDSHMKERKRLYTEEGKQYFHGELYVPDDREKIWIK